MVVYYDPRAAEYGINYHPERPARLLRSEPYLHRQHADWVWRQADPARDEAILRVHDAEHLARLQAAEDFDSDTPSYPGIDEHARRAAGGAIAAMQEAFGGQRAFSFYRPPGHHATRNQAMGFCYLNSIAIAAFAALELGCERVAIWDFDAHHGNGTEAIVRGHPAIRFASIHQNPGYPGTGQKSFENVLNYPIAPRSSAEAHAAAVRDALERLVQFEPGMLLVSAGFDAFAGDPITDMTLEVEHFAQFGTWLHEAGIRSCAILEGGYSGELPQLIDAFLTGWEGG
jgi:acetoin utilization deacetylase AcuC-like enzyme